ncbi:hypothetical protein KAU92_06580, partial [Candidatus Bathyarchaeota archaeon]|nr:hypothetical protein [Candidatus Bathyarchaeota archaeon]
MKKIVSGIMLMLLLMFMWTLAFNIREAKPSEPPTTEWSRIYGGTNDDRAFSVVQTVDGGYAIAGETESFGAGGKDFWLVKTDWTGGTLWNRTYGGPNWDQPLSVVQTVDGGYAIAGETRSFGNGSWDLWLVKTDASGSMQWNQTYGGPDIDRAFSVVQTVDGGYAIAGETRSFGNGTIDVWLVETNSTGHMQWNQTYGGVDWDYALSLVQTSDGGYAIAGTTESFGAGGRDFWLIKLSPVQISATVDIEPNTLNLKSEGEWITCYIELPEGYNVS